LLHSDDDLAIRPGRRETVKFRATQPGRYRAVVRAVDTSGAVGQAVAEFEVEQPPVELSLAAPSHLTEGDRGSAQVVLRNRSAEAQTARLTMSGEGLRMDPARTTVEVAAGQRLHVPVALEAREAGDRQLLAELRIGKATLTAERQVHIREAEALAEPGEAMSLRRQYLRVVRTGGKAAAERLRGPAAPGDELEVRIGVRLDRDCEQLVIQDSVPGGCELAPSGAAAGLQPHLAALVDWLGFARYRPYWYGQQPSLAPPIVDGRVTLVSEKVKAGVHEVSYRLVALDPGTYAVGPLVAKAKAGEEELSAAYGEPDRLRIAERGGIRLASARLDEEEVEVTLEADSPRSDGVAGTLTISYEGLDGTRRTVLEERCVLEPGHDELTRRVPRPADVEGAMVQVAFRAVGVWLGDSRSLQSLAGRQSLRLLGQNELAAGSTASIRLIALTEADSKPIRNAEVELALLPEEGEEPAISLLAGKTNDKGTMEASFEVPQEAIGDRRLVARVSSPYGEETVEQPVAIKEPTRILLTTDKPLYQPNQLMHIRCLALRQYDLKPMKQTKATLEVEDGKGNKVFKHIGETSDFGVLAADFQLADWVNEGEYRIRAIVGETQLEKTVNVKKYVLPKFKVQVETDKDFYFPGDQVKGSVQCDYFFGKPVRGGKVTLTFSSFVEKFEEFARVSGVTDEKGHWDFETTLPDHFVGQPLAEGNATVQIQAEVVDTADHKETKHHVVTVSDQSMNVVVLPESGTLVPGVPNVVYVAVNYPDGSSVQEATLKVVNQADGRTLLEGKSDELGLAEFKVVPQQESLNLGITAVDKNGREATHERTVTPEDSGEAVLLRTSKALAKVGDRLDVSVLTNAARGTVYLDLIKNRQTLLTKTVELNKGKGAFSLPLTPDMSGTIALSAYKIALSGEIVRDQRPVYVEPANDLKINVVPDSSIYEPGQPARIDFRVTDRQGKGVLAALGVTIVDESVFALQEVQPGLLKVYFTLEKEILQPRYQIKGFKMPDLVVARAEDEKAKPAATRQRAAEVLMAGAAQIADYTLDINTRQDRETVAMERAGKILGAVRGRNYFYQYRKQRDDYFKAHKAYPLQDKGVAYLAELKLIEPEDCLDPWGRTYTVAFGSGAYGPRLRVISAGPDGIHGTLDDVEPPARDDYYYGYYVLTESARKLLQTGAPGGRLAFTWGPVDRDARVTTVGGVWGGGGYGYGGFGGYPAAAEGAAVADAAGVDAIPVFRAAGGPPGQRGDRGPRGEPGEPGPAAPVEREVRIRQWFPETLYNNPQIITDEQGRASVELTMADSITEWRLTALGSSPGGLLGSRSLGVKAFQDFFVDIDLPVALT
ncbi:MAG: MG2 domain-containing protein, partial [Armatimonadota bacterium]